MASPIPIQNYDPKSLPPGFRFHPTDEELVISYLVEKVINPSFRVHAITEVDLNKCEPWDLPEKAEMGEKEWYFFSLRDRKYPTGMRTNRATEAGYWKATGKDRDVNKAKGGLLVGMKKTLVFYKGRAPRGEKTNWIMHEYRLEREGSALVARRLPAHKFSGKDEWVVCRIFKKQSGSKKNLCQVDSMLDPYRYGDPSSPLHDHPDMDDDRETSVSPYGTNRVTSFKELVSPSALTSGNPLCVMGELNAGRCVFPSYSSSSFPGNNTASLSPTTGPMSSDLSSTLQSPAYAELPSHHLNNILNVVPSSAPNYTFAGTYSMMPQMLNQPMLQGGHMGGLRSCKVEYMGTLGEDEAHSGQTSSSAALLDSISPNIHGWISTQPDELQFAAGQHPVTMQPRHAQITQDQLNFFPAPESSCVTEENANALYRQQMHPSLASRFLQGDNSTSGLVHGWA